MSGVFVSLQSFDVTELDAVAGDLCFVDKCWRRIYRKESSSAVLSRFDQENLWAPATDPHSEITAILVGRIALDDNEWKVCGDLPYEGGLACRHILDAWQRLGNDFTSELNGAFGIFLLHHSAGKVTVVTDRAGFFPLYKSGSAANLTVCSHSDVLARYVSTRGDYDLVSMAEMLVRRTEHPHTYYDGIKQLEPGSIYTFSTSRSEEQITYWRPLVSRDADISASKLSYELASTL